MDFEKTLEPSSSKAIIDLVVSTVGNNPDRFMELLEITTSKRSPIAFRAAWAIGHIVEKHPELIENHYNTIVKTVLTTQERGVRRCLLRAMNFHPLPQDEDLLGELLDRCFVWLNSPDSQTSLKYYSMDFLYRMAKMIPEIKKEFADNLEQILPYQSASFKNRAKKILKEYNH
jgi:hypothetical protein